MPLQLAGKLDATYPAFVYRYRPLGEVFAAGALDDTAWLVVLNIFAFAFAYTGFVSADVR